VVRAVTIARQQLSKQTLNNGATLFSVGSVQRAYLEDHRRYSSVLRVSAKQLVLGDSFEV
jgi:hypothetical protein